MKKVALFIGIALMLVAVLVVLAGCGSKTEGVVGKWEYNSFVYTFNADKTGTYDALGNLMKFTYEDDGSKLSILFEGNTAPMELEYKLEGNKLIITDSFGEDVEYVKK